MAHKSLSIFCVLCGLLSKTVQSAENPSTPSDQQPDPAVLVTMLNQHCVDCHSGEDHEGDFDVRSLLEQTQLGQNGRVDIDRSDVWGRVFRVLATKQMPPVEAQQPTRVARTRALMWLKWRLQKSGVVSDWQRKLLFPEYGNYVDHESLFDGSVREVAWSPSRLWKKSPHIFDSLANRGMGFRPGRYGVRSAHLAKVKQPFAMEDKAGVKDFAAIMFSDSATLGTMLRNAEVIVDAHLAGALHQLRESRDGPTPEDQLPRDKNGKPVRPRYPETPVEFRSIILSEEMPTEGQIHSAITKMFQLSIERLPDKSELEKYQRLMEECAARGGQVEGLRMILVAIAVSPPAVYRLELGQGPVDEHGRQMLGPADLAFAVAYALTDQKPDEKLLEAAQSGRLTTREDVAREASRYWDDKSVEKPRILRFFHEFFGYHAAPGVFKDAARFGKDYRNVPERLVQDADALVLHIVNRDRDVLKELLTTEKYFVAHSGDNAGERETHDALQKFYDYYKDKPWRKFPYQVPKEHMAHVRSIHRMFTHANGNVTKRWMNYLERCDKAGITHMPMPSGRDYITAYNLDDRAFSYPVEQPFVLAPKERIGILMHPAWLIAQSLNLDNDPVRRGKWIRERLLADTVPELPITVDASIPDHPEQSLRQRFAVTREAECWRCHVKMNPLGMPFELYDDFGRHRLVEALHAKGKTHSVDASGVLSGTDDAALDGEVENPIDLMHRLARSKRVRQSFVRHAFRYWMGRNEILSDSATLIAADRAYTKNNGSFRAMVLSLLTSDSFLYRRSQPQDKVTKSAAR